MLFGPSGTGKTLLARTVAQKINVNFIVLNGPDIIGKHFGESEEKLRASFHEAIKNGPSLIFIDEIDSLCPKRSINSNQTQNRIVATLLTLMQTSQKSNFVVIGATNRPDAIDDALRRPGRFDREIEIGIPNAIARLSILTKMLSNIPNSLSNKDIENIANITHGYVGADLASLCREAGISHIKTKTMHLKDPNVQTILDLSNDSNFLINLSDIEYALRLVKPSAMREIKLEVPKVFWSDIGGQHDIKQSIKETVQWPLTNPDSFKRFNIRPPRGILLYGPPGCSKTLMAKALATESSLNFIAVKGPELFSKYVGESEKAIKEIFRKARLASPSIIFFDEIDALAVTRSGGEENGTSANDRVLSQLLQEMDGIESVSQVIVLAATNRPDIIVHLN